MSDSFKKGKLCEQEYIFNDQLTKNKQSEEEKKDVFYLTTHFIYGYIVKDHSDSERGNPLPPHGLLFSINSGFFYMHHPTVRIIHTTDFVTPVVVHWLEREIYTLKFISQIQERDMSPR